MNNRYVFITTVVEGRIVTGSTREGLTASEANELMADAELVHSIAPDYYATAEIWRARE